MVARYRNKSRLCDLDDVAADSGEDHLIDLVAEDRRNQVREALNDLPQHERDAIVRVVLQGASLRAVAREQRRFGDDDSTSRQTRARQPVGSAEAKSAIRLSVPIDLPLQGVHRSGDSSELTLQTITPEGQHGHLAGLVMATAVSYTHLTLPTTGSV